MNITNYDYFTWVEQRKDGSTRTVGVVHPSKYGRFINESHASEALHKYLHGCEKQQLDNAYYVELASNNKATE